MKLPLMMVAMMATIGFVDITSEQALAQQVAADRVTIDRVTAAKPGNAILMAFHSPHCRPCHAMTGVLQTLGDQGVPIRHVDATTEHSLTRRYSISQTPTYIVMLGGKELTRLVGVQSPERLRRALLDDGTGPLRQTASQVAAANQPRTRMAPAAGAWDQLSQDQSRRDQSRRDQSVGRTGLASIGGQNEAMPSLAVADAIERAEAATVRLRVFDGHGYGVGTGTIIDTHGEEALVLTCGHLFRESAKEGRIEVDVFVGGQPKTVVGQLIDYEAKNRDIAVVAIKPGVEITPVEIAVVSPVEVGTAAFSFGCDRGKDPSRRDTRITGVDKYNQHLGASNYEIDGAPIDGRSGGGLFDRGGRLIGVCNAADYDNDTGIYAGAGEVRWQLDRINMAALYENVSPIAVAQAGGGNFAPSLDAPSRQDFSAPPAFTGQSTSNGEPTPSKELIVIVRDPATGRDRVMTIKNPSHQLMAAVEADHDRR